MIVVYPGSFDPITEGHVDVIERAACMFDKVIVCVTENKSKHHMFTLEERVQIIKLTLEGISNVEVASWDGLVTQFAYENKADAIIRGVRGGSDIDKECQMAQVNRNMSKSFETIFIPSDVRLSHVSSTAVRELLKYLPSTKRDLENYMRYQTFVAIHHIISKREVSK